MGRNGGYADRIRVNSRFAIPVPEVLESENVAPLLCAGITVYSPLRNHGVRPSSRVGIIGIGGLGHLGVQFAKAFGAEVWTTVGSDEKAEAARRAGADVAINHREQDFAAVVRERTAKRGVDVILDIVGGDYVERNLRSLAVGGRLVNIAFLQGSKVTVDLLPVMTKRLTVTGSTLRPRTIAEKAALAQALREHVWPRLARGECRPWIHATFPLERAAEAHRLMEASGHIGKILLQVRS